MRGERSARSTSASASSRPAAASWRATFSTLRASVPVPTVRSLTSSPTAVEPAPRRRSSCQRSSRTAPACASKGSVGSIVLPMARSASARRSRNAATSGSRSLTAGRVASSTIALRADGTCGRSAARSRPPSRAIRSRTVTRSDAGGRPASTAYARAPSANTSRRTRSAPVFHTPSGAWNASACRRSASTPAGCRMTPSRSTLSAPTSAVTPVSAALSRVAAPAPCQSPTRTRSPEPGSSLTQTASGLRPRCTTRCRCA